MNNNQQPATILTGRALIPNPSSALFGQKVCPGCQGAVVKLQPGDAGALGVREYRCTTCQIVWQWEGAGWLRWIPPDPPAAPATIQERFLAFHGRHPEIYQRLVQTCRQALDRGIKRWGIAGALEVSRFESLGEGKPFRVSTTFKSRYARLIAHQEPDLRDFFTTRVLKS